MRDGFIKKGNQRLLICIPERRPECCDMTGAFYGNHALGEARLGEQLPGMRIRNYRKMDMVSFNILIALDIP